MSLFLVVMVALLVLLLLLLVAGKAGVSALLWVLVLAEAVELLGRGRVGRWRARGQYNLA